MILRATKNAVTAFRVSALCALFFGLVVQVRSVQFSSRWYIYALGKAHMHNTRSLRSLLGTVDGVGGGCSGSRGGGAHLPIPQNLIRNERRGGGGGEGREDSGIYEYLVPYTLRSAKTEEIVIHRENNAC